MHPPKNGTLPLSGGSMDYIRFGQGPALVLLPGLGDGLRTVKGAALPMSLLYRTLGRFFTVYGFSRREPLPPGFSTRDMAADQAAAMDALGIPRAHVVGVSMGGMIAQHLAADFPHRVNRLVLVSTTPGDDPLLRQILPLWTALAKGGNHTALMDSNLTAIYSPAYCRRNRWLVPIAGKVTRPRSYRRFLLQAEACRDHDGRQALPRITAPTLVVGGQLDRVVSPEGSRRLAEAIPGAVLRMYPQWGHGLYEEAGDFQALVTAFLARR